MSLTALNNNPGDHEHYEFITGRQQGKYYGSDNIDEVTYSESFPVEHDIKWYPTPGYAGCTDWSRSVRKYTSNEPARWHRHETVGNPPDEEVIINLTGDHHLCIDYRLGSYNIPNEGLDNARSQSITQALNRLYANYVGIGQDLAEARQTIDQFSNAVMNGYRFLKAVKQRNIPELRRIATGTGKRGRKAPITEPISNLWLEWSFGWKPLASDIYETQQLVHKVLKKGALVKATANGRSNGDVSFTYGGYLRVVGASSGQHHTVLLGHIENERIYLLNSAGLFNPISIAWEVVPFSFVTDWFLPVGNTLQACNAACGLKSDGGFTSTRISDKLIISRVVEDNHVGNGFWYEHGGNLIEEGFQFHRQCHVDFPMPEFYANVTPFSTTRSLNAAALVLQGL